jgi:hypothetical protein
MPNNPQAFEIVYTPEFKRNLRQLAKKYRHIKSHVQPLIEELTQGRTPGDQIPGIRYEVFKARARNSWSQRQERWLSGYLFSTQ